MAPAGDVTYKFHWADYLVFVLSLLMSLAVGVFFYFLDRNKSERTNEILLGGKQLHFFPVAISLMASILNGVFIIGVPAEIYYFGPVYTLIGVTFLTVGILVALVFLPVFRRLQLTSAYEYFDRRYKFPPLRIAVSLTWIVSMLTFLAAVLYVPALAFSEVSHMSLYWSILATGVICTVYTTIGGIKTVIWTDTLQTAIILAGLLTMVIVGVDNAGGYSHVLDVVTKGNRMKFDVWSANPHDRYTIWTQLIGQFFAWSAVLGTNQMAVQRYMTIPSSLKTQLSMATAIPLCWLLLALVTCLAFAMYVHYEHCDPFIRGYIPKADMIVPRYMMEVLGDYHGLPGLFTAAVFAAALSSVSSALNSLAAVILEDFVKPVCPWKLTDRHTTRVCMVIAFISGVVTVGLSFVAEHMGDHIVDIPVTIWATTGAPIMGVFLLALFVPWSNGPGSLVGLLVSVAFSLWMSIGGMLYGALPMPMSPIGLSCLFDNVGKNVTESTMSTTTGSTTTRKPIVIKGPVTFQEFYDISYVWYAGIALFISLAVGLVASALFRLVCPRYAIPREEIEPTLLYNWADRCFCYCPASCRDEYRQGEPYSYLSEVRGQDMERNPEPGTQREGDTLNVHAGNGALYKSTDNIELGGVEPYFNNEKNGDGMTGVANQAYDVDDNVRCRSISNVSSDGSDIGDKTGADNVM